MGQTKHEIAEVRQRDDEDRPYTFDASAITDDPQGVSCTLKDVTDEDSVTTPAGKLSGVASVSEANITTQSVGNLKEGRTYRLITTFTAGASGPQYARYFTIVATGDGDN